MAFVDAFVLATVYTFLLLQRMLHRLSIMRAPPRPLGYHTPGDIYPLVCGPRFPLQMPEEHSNGTFIFH